MNFLNQHIFEVIFFAVNQYYFTLLLWLILVFKLRITGAFLLLHGIILFIYNVNLQYELSNVSELTKSVYWAFYEENLFDILFYGTLSIPLLFILWIILDWWFTFNKKLAKK